jgi:cell division protein FtsN
MSRVMTAGSTPWWRRLVCVAGAVCFLDATRLAAQAATTVDQAVGRARALVEAGDGRAGRMVLDSLVRQAGVATPALGELLYWRGLLAESSADAERDWRRLLVEVPMSPRAEDALLRLAQLEQLRGRPAASRPYLERLARDFSEPASQARAHFWLAKAYFDENDRPRACGALDVVRQRVPSNAVELRAQAEDLRTRCRGVTATAPLSATTAVASNDDQRAATLRDAQRRDSLVRDSTARAAQRQAEREQAEREATARAQREREERERSERERQERERTERERLERERADRERTTSAPPAPTPAQAAPVVPPADGARPASARFSVQLAAVNTRADADRLVERFRGRGIEARVDGTGAPFRVRTGYFATRALANVRLAELKAKGLEGFIAELTP